MLLFETLHVADNHLPSILECLDLSLERCLERGLVLLELCNSFLELVDLHAQVCYLRFVLLLLFCQILLGLGF